MTSFAGDEFQMWVTFAIIGATLAAYALEKWPMELTSLGAISAILIFFQFFPVPPSGGGTGLNPDRILAGFSNPALISVLALLVMGQGIIRTGILDRGADWFLTRTKGRVPLIATVLLAFAVVAAVSAFLNNTPVVVIFIPIMQAVAARYGVSACRVMMPLSYAAILGGMTTLIGSSTNLLVNSALIEIGETPLGFFQFTGPGVVLCAVGLIYVSFIAPRILPERAGLADNMLAGDGKQFLMQLEIEAGSKLVGQTAPGGHFKILPDITVRMIQRGERAILPPFEDVNVLTGDVLVVAATRKALKDALTEHRDLFHPSLDDGAEDTDEDDEDDAPWRQGHQVLAEAMVAPASRLIGQNLRLAGFRYKTGCIVLGIQRRARMFRARITEIRLEVGDVLLMQGPRENIRDLRGNRDVVLIESSAEDLPSLDHAKRAGAIFVAVVALAGAGVLPIVVCALAGAVAMVGTGVLNLRQAFRAVDPKIATAIAAALAMSVALRETGGAAYLAGALVTAVHGAGPAAIASILFLAAAVMTNIISNNAVAVLFTPVAVDLAVKVGAPVEAFAIAIVFAANCSFASPIGYQTNLLVMGPGHYRFSDYVRAGVPLMLVMWGAYTLIGPFFFGY